MNKGLRGDEVLTVAEAATVLRLTPQSVRDLIAAGELPAERLGRMFVVPREQVLQLSRSERPVGRPLHPTTAWQLIAVLSGRSPRSLGVQRPGRLREQMCARGAEDLAVRLRVRARPQGLEIATTAWRRLLEDPRVVPSGAGLALTEDAYVAADDLAEVTARYGLQPAEGPGGLVLRSVPRSVPPALGPRRPRVPEAVRHLDLFERADEERHGTGSRGFTRLWEQACSRTSS